MWRCEMRDDERRMRCVVRTKKRASLRIRISSGFERMDLTYSTGRPLHRLIPSVLASEISHAFDRIPIL